MPTGTGFVGVKGMHTRSFRDGGSRRVALPDPGVDVTDTESARRRTGGAHAIAQRPERRLMLAVLEDAMHVLRKYGPDAQGRFPSPKARGLWLDARDWLFPSDDADDGDWLFTAANVCAELGLDLDATRRALTTSLPCLAQHQADTHSPEVAAPRRPPRRFGPGLGPSVPPPLAA